MNATLVIKKAALSKAGSELGRNVTVNAADTSSIP